MTAGWVAIAGITGLAGLAIGWRFAVRRNRTADLQKTNAANEQVIEISTLAGGLAHEIRNPLSTLNLNLQLLREDLTHPGRPVEPRTLARLDALEQEIRRLQAILDDFLRFAGKYEVRLEVRPINPIVEEAVAFYAARLQQAAVQVRTRFAEGLPAVAVDAGRLKQALSNLFLNAEAAMPRGGELMISTEAERRGVRIHVTDTGAGIPQEHLDKIFEPYYSTRPGGTGLGLPTVRRIIREHGAAIEVHSEVGRGTRFTIHLPAAGPTRQ